MRDPVEKEIIATDGFVASHVAQTDQAWSPVIKTRLKLPGFNDGEFFAFSVDLREYARSIGYSDESFDALLDEVGSKLTDDIAIKRDPTDEELEAFVAHELKQKE
jgi:hypothetical protein